MTSPSWAPRSTREAASSWAPARSIVPSSARGVTIAVSTRPKGRAGSGFMGRIYRPAPDRRSPVDRLARVVEPDLEEVVESGHLGEARLGERDEVLDTRAAVAVRGLPVVQQPQEGRVVPDLHPERLQRHRPALVDRVVEEVRRVPRVARRRVPEVGPRRRGAVVLLEELLS